MWQVNPSTSDTWEINEWINMEDGDGDGALLSVSRPSLGQPSIMVPPAMLVCFGNEWADIYPELTNSLTH